MYDGIGRSERNFNWVHQSAMFHVMTVSYCHISCRDLLRISQVEVEVVKAKAEAPIGYAERCTPLINIKIV